MFSKKTCGLPSGRPSFIKISLRFARAVGGLAAARSRSRSDNTPCCHSLRSRRYATPAPTRFVGFLIFVCRGGYYPPAFIKISFCLTRDYSISPKQKYPPVAYGWIFDFLIRISPCFPQPQQRELPLRREPLPQSQQREPLPQSQQREPLPQSQQREPLPLLR